MPSRKNIRKRYFPNNQALTVFVTRQLIEGQLIEQQLIERHFIETTFDRNDI